MSAAGRVLVRVEYVGLLLCDTRRARRWQRALGKAGIVATVAETIGEEADAGACKVSVPRRDLPAANHMVTAVTRGEVTLPGTGISPMTIIALVVIVALVGALVGALASAR